VQQLHLVGITTELDGLIFSTRKGAKSGSFVVRMDDSLIESIEQAARLRQAAPSDNGSEPSRPVRVPRLRVSRPESRLTPREMQARLRSGHTITQVAESAGVDEEWVERFAAPVLAEQTRILDMAHALVTKSRRGMSALPLGESVRANLHDKGVAYSPDLDGWTAYTLDGTNWILKLAYVSRKRTQEAEWELDTSTGSVVPRNRLASELGYVDSARVRRRPLPEEDLSSDGEPETKPARSRGSRRSRARRPARSRKSAATGKATARKATTRKAPARKAPARKATARRTTTTKTTTKRAPAKKAAAKKSTTRTAATKKAASAGKATARKARPLKAARRSGR